MIYIRHCQESNSQPVPSQAGADTTRPQSRLPVTSKIKWDVKPHQNPPSIRHSNIDLEHLRDRYSIIDFTLCCFRSSKTSSGYYAIPGFCYKDKYEEDITSISNHSVFAIFEIPMENSNRLYILFKRRHFRHFVLARSSVSSWVGSALPDPVLHTGQLYRRTLTSPFGRHGHGVCAWIADVDNWTSGVRRLLSVCMEQSRSRLIFMIPGSVIWLSDVDSNFICLILLVIYLSCPFDSYFCIVSTCLNILFRHKHFEHFCSAINILNFLSGTFWTYCSIMNNLNIWFVINMHFEHFVRPYIFEPSVVNILHSLFNHMNILSILS